MVNQINPKIKKLGLRKNFIWATFGTIASALSQMGLFTIIQKMLGTEALGQYVIATAISMPIFLFTGLSLGRVMVVDVADKYSFGEYLGVRMFLNFTAILIIIGIIFQRGYSTSLIIVISLVALYESLLTVIQASLAVFQKHECMNYHSISRIIQGFLVVLGMMAGVYVTGRLVGGILTMFILVLLKFLFYDLYSISRIEQVIPKFNFSLLKRIIKDCWVISIASGLASFPINVPRYIIKGRLDEVYLGYFTGIGMVTTGMMLIIASLTASALRRQAIYFSTDVPKFMRLLFKIIAISFCFGIINILFTFIAGKLFLTIFLDRSYISYISAMYLYAVAGIFLAVVSIVGDTIISTRRYWWRIIASIAGSLVLYFSGRLLIGRYGLNGVSFACIIGFIVEMVVCAVGLIILANQQKRNHALAIKPDVLPDTLSGVNI